jgi:hypothetical protein
VIIAWKRNLGSATLTVAVRILFVGLVLATLLLLVLAGLTALLALAGLSRLTALLALAGLAALLALSELVTLLTFLFHIICHKNVLLKSASVPAPSDLSAIYHLVAARDCKGWEVTSRLNGCLNIHTVLNVVQPRAG